MASLDSMISSHDALKLVSSHELFPDAQGEGLPLLQLKTPLCEAVIALQGAQLLTFKSRGGKNLLWLSPNCQFQPGTPLRGGIPVCLPWFGPHPTDPDKPKHGFARNRDWTLTRVSQTDEGHYQLAFGFTSDSDPLFSQGFVAELQMQLGESIKLHLSVENHDARPLTCSWALHTYLPTADIKAVRLPALAGAVYADNLDEHKRKTQDGPMGFTGAELDRVFPRVAESLVVENQPRLAVESANCPSAIVWNPGPEKAAGMADVGAGHAHEFVCVERGAALEEAWVLAPGERQGAWLEIRALNPA